MSWINRISQGIEKAFSGVRPALKSIPPLLLICEVYKRPGLSAIAMTTSVIRRLPEAAIETGVNPCGAPNMINSFIRIFCEELTNEIHNNARVTCVIEPSSIKSTGTGTNAYGPVIVTSLNTKIGKIFGIIQ